MPPPAQTSLGYVPPDGGWGWAVVFGAFISIGFSYAFPKSTAVFFKEIQDFFGTTYSEIAWVSSIMLATMYALGPISSILVKRFGSRPVVMCGGLLCSIGMISASFCTSILQLYLCAGFITGLGLSFNLQPSVIIVGKYFLKRRPLANGLAMAGSPVMLFTLAPLKQLLFDNFGWRGSFFILGAIFLNCCVAGSLFRPIGPPVNPTGKPNILKKEDTGIVEMADPGPGDKEDKGCWSKFSTLLDLSLFKHRGFLIYLIGNVFMFLGFFAPIVFLTPYGKHMGIDEYSAAFLLSILAIVDMIARPTTGLVANSKWVRPKIQYFFSFSIILNGTCHILCPLAKGYSGLVVYAAFYGLTFGMVCAMLFETLMDLVGAARFTSAVGLVTIMECFTILLGPPMGGTIIDVFGDYKYMFIICGSIMVSAGIFLFIMNFYNYRMLAKEEKAREKCGKVEMEDKGLLRTHAFPEKEDTTKGDNKQGGHEEISLKSEDSITSVL